jgi:thymidine kinase
MEIERFKRQDKRIAIFKPKIDDRYSESEIVTHMGWRFPAHVVQHGNDVIKFLADADPMYDVIVVDELFMIPGIAEVLIWLFRNGFTVIVASLDLSSSGKAFKEVEKILPWATYIKKCPAVCTICGKDAFYTHKKQEDEKEISVGGENLYEPRCFAHHLVINNKQETFPTRDE